MKNDAHMRINDLYDNSYAAWKGAFYIMVVDRAMHRTCSELSDIEVVYTVRNRLDLELYNDEE